MKKSMIAAAVVATAFAATANAGYFNVTGASYNSGGAQTITGSGFSGGAGTLNTRSNLLDAAQTGSANTVTAMTATTLSNITSALGSTYTSGAGAQLTYFSFEDSSTPALGYFGMAFWSGSLSFGFNTNWNDDAIYGSKGVLVSSDAAGYNQSAGTVVPDTFLSNGTIAANTLYVIVFGGVGNGDGFDGNFNRSSTETRTFNINYLSNSSGNFVSVGSGSNASTSSLSVATYVVPVPAPALLAGAGLVGAAALRRRMAKKA